jgi:subtilisin family serine protease
MAALGKGIGRRAEGGCYRRGAFAALAAAALGVTSNVPPAMASGDPLFAKQWNLVQIGAPAAWQRSTGSGIRIGIVDTGVDGLQEDLTGKVVAAADCINTAGDPNACGGSGRDDSGHGTHMAGIAAAAKDNGRGIAGVAPDATLVVARVLTNEGGSIADVEAGIRWVVRHGAQVVNLSLGDNGRAQNPVDLSFHTAVEEAWAAGAVPVVTSGNPNALGPGKEDFAKLDALVVGATDARGGVASYSNPLTTAKWGIVAPGGSGTNDARDIVSTWWDASVPAATDRYVFRGGASMAAAHVSGVVALLLAQGLSPDAAVQQIIATARPISCGAGCHGRLDAAAAVSAPRGPVRVAGGALRATAAAPAPRRAAPAATNPPAAAPAAPAVPTTAPPVSEAPATSAPGDATRERFVAAAAGGGGAVPARAAVWAAVVLLAGAATGLASRARAPAP